MSSSGGETGAPPLPRLLRSPSHESISTEISLFSVSSIASDMTRAGLKVVLPPHLGRGPSPTPQSRHRLQVPAGCSGGNICAGYRDSSVTGLWGEEESDLIKTCGALASILGLYKSFSTSDIAVPPSESATLTIRNWASELNVNGPGGRLELFPARLDPASRSYSTWVAVGDIASTSQLPSPQARQCAGGAESPAITAADFIRSVNKKVRQDYIKQRLMSTYKAIKRFSKDVQFEAGSQTEIKVDNGGVTLMLPSRNQSAQDVIRIIKKEVELSPSPYCSTTVYKNSTSLTARDVERERGRPLTKYERNMMIFNWLQTLEESTT